MEHRVKYPDIVVRLTGIDGNAFSVMGAVAREMKRAGLSDQEIADWRAEAMSGDYDHLLQSAMKTVNVV